MKVNNIIRAIGATILVSAALLSCQDTLEEQYLNPEKTTEASIGKFFTKMLDNNRVRAEYWNIRTFLVMHPAVYTNAVSYVNTTRRYQQQLSYLDDFWRDYYTPRGSGISGVMPHMREIEKAYNELSDEEKAKADVYLHAARVVFYDQTAKMVDLWGDIPYSEAGLLNLTGEIKSPKFDSAEEVYNALLQGLKESAHYFSTASVDPLVSAAFAKQDILLQGSTAKWQRYANSLRLRLLMRISLQNEGKAQTDVMEMLNNPSAYPLVEETAHNILLSPVLTYTDFMRNAVTELNSHLAPEFLLEDVLKPANDPRIRVLFDKNVSAGVPNVTYNAMPSGATASEQEQNITAGKYAVLDSSTFLFNTAFPGIVFTAAEVNFLRAEAFERWGSSTDARTAYEKAVTQSVQFNFYLNALGAGITGRDAEPPASEVEMTVLLASPTVEYAGTTAEKLAKIWTQKWVNFGFIQSIESWAEVRRTNTPDLSFLPDNSTPGSELPPSRLLYPGTEKTYNEHYSDVAANDTPVKKIFWDVN
jgi:hypothetical protein